MSGLYRTIWDGPEEPPAAPRDDPPAAAFSPVKLPPGFCACAVCHEILPHDDEHFYRSARRLRRTCKRCYRAAVKAASVRREAEEAKRDE